MEFCFQNISVYQDSNAIMSVAMNITSSHIPADHCWRYYALYFKIMWWQF